MTRPETRTLAPSAVQYGGGDGPSNHAQSLFIREVEGSCLRHVARDHRVPVDAASVATLGEFAALVEASDGRGTDKAFVLRHPSGEMTLVWLWGRCADITTAGDDASRAEAICREVAATVRAPDRVDPGVTPIDFWATGRRGLEKTRHHVGTPAWSEIAGNYTEAAARGMSTLLALDQLPGERMILWHGPPGNGKTHAVRALAREWRSWCDVAFVTDPETLFGGSPTYLFTVAGATPQDSNENGKRRSKLIVLEDAGELMAVEARAKTGQGLSRLLNLTDGLIGQAFEAMVLITTNEPLGTLHPAVIRPGRCLAEIEFGALSTAEANAWLKTHDSTETVDSPTTLAELYAILAGHIQPQRRREFGFAARAAAA